ncbi:hypothetical protein TrST_g481 [Triparma strigata]|uniref:Uncharacterized protein n=1 Tax=Triparma strigata TaxID=1606541 RepID=A0A9W7BZ83_9STRA|nr:hypothetical protein TrST_g481 [Triparma strigata]
MSSPSSPASRLSPSSPSSHINVQPPPPRSDASYILSLSGHRDLTRRRHESHDLNWCRDQLTQLSKELRRRMDSVRIREERVGEIEGEVMQRCSIAVEEVIREVNRRVKGEYETRLNDLERVVRTYDVKVKSVVDENARLKRELRETKLENAKIKVDREREAKEREREKRRADIKKWKDGKKEGKVEGKEGGGGSKAAGGSNSGGGEKELQLAVATLKQKLELASRTASLFEMGCMGMSSLFPSPVNGAAKGGARKVKEIAPCLVRMCAAAETAERKLGLCRAINFITADKESIKTGKAIDTTGFAKTVKDWMDDKDAVIRFEAAICIIRNAGREGELVEKAAELLADSVGVHGGVTKADEYVIKAHMFIKIIMNMFFYPNAKSVNSACKVWLHLIGGGRKAALIEAVTSEENIEAFKDTVVNIFSPPASVRKSNTNVMPAMVEEVQDVVSIVLQNAAAKRPPRLKGLRRVIERHLRESGGGQDFKTANLRSFLDYTAGA